MKRHWLIIIIITAGTVLGLVVVAEHWMSQKRQVAVIAEKNERDKYRLLYNRNGDLTLGGWHCLGLSIAPCP
jgi:hypothetical protein